MENTNNTPEKFEVIREPEKLNSAGCSFFVDADNTEETWVSSTLLRWFSYSKDGNPTQEQKLAIEKILCEAQKTQQKNRDKAPRFLMHILLYSDPRKLNEEDSKYIKALLQCIGVEMRYLKATEDHKLRICLKGGKIFLSMSGNQQNEVHEGILYETTSEHNPLLKYFKAQFSDDFNKAKRLSLVRNKIVYADNWIKRFFQWCKTENGIVAIITTIIATIISIIIELSI